MWPACLFPVDLVFAERKEKSMPLVTLASTEFLFLVSAWACKWQQLNSLEMYVESKAPTAPSSIRVLRTRSSHCWKSSVAYGTRVLACDLEPGRQKLFGAHSRKKSTATPRSPSGTAIATS